MKNPAKVILIVCCFILTLVMHSPSTAAGQSDRADDRMTRLAAGEILVEAVDEDSDGHRGTVLVKTPWERIWQGLTEHEYFTRIFEENKGAVLLERTDDYDVYCFHARYFLMAFDYCLQRRLDRQARRIAWRLTEGDFEEMDGEWLLEPVNDGEATLVSFTNRVKIGSWIPESWVRRSNRKHIPDPLEALRFWGETGRFLPEE